jgi:hypothetical protein
MGFVVLIEIMRDDCAGGGIQNMVMDSAEDVIGRTTGRPCSGLAIAIHRLRQGCLSPLPALFCLVKDH